MLGQNFVAPSELCAHFSTALASVVIAWGCLISEEGMIIGQGEYAAHCGKVHLTFMFLFLRLVGLHCVTSPCVLALNFIGAHVGAACLC